MQKSVTILLSLLLTIPVTGQAQDTLSFRGQVSGWLRYGDGTDIPFYFGARYIPQLNYVKPLNPDHKIDFEASLNINGSAGLEPFDYFRSEGRIKPYRIWGRYSTSQLEIRAGLQKINFGSANLLRPLMWFDQVDPRDPLKLTDGVWGVLCRYYFLNNANIWLWGLYGNNNRRGWEYAPTSRNIPEAGGRIQLPVPSGEAALTFHHRDADAGNFTRIPENRIGFDTRLDLVIGLWLEGSWVKKNADLGILTNQEILNAGADYTFSLGNGLYVIYEQLLAAGDEKPFRFESTVSFSLLSLSYPLTLSDNLSAIIYYDWKNRNTYNFLNWQKQLRNFTLYVMGYWNPEHFNLPAQGEGQNIFTGKGMQVMMVFNY
jgi:hypothetical protein